MIGSMIASVTMEIKEINAFKEWYVGDVMKEK